MKNAFLPVALAGLLLLGAGCAASSTNAPENANVNAPAATTTPESTATTTPAAATSTPAAPAATKTNTNTSTKNGTSTTAVRKTFYVEFDDNGAYPKSGTAAKGTTVTVTFKVRPTNVFYNGLAVKSNTQDLGKIAAGQSETVTFTAVEDETFVAQWITGTTKARWTLIVR